MTAGTDELLTALDSCLGAAVTGLERRPSAYSSSFRMEELEVRLADGRTLAMVFKDLRREEMLDGARRTKPAFLYDPLREIETYRKILAPDPLGTAFCHSAVADEARGRYWLFLEKVPGRELYQVGDLTVWQEAARWLAELHSRFTGREDFLPLARASHLLIYGPDFYRRWIDRARAAHPSLERLAAGYGRVVERLAALPATLLHGDFYASNVLVEQIGGDLRVCPVDWEMAAVGPGLLDLAALTAGRWTDEERTVLALAYRGALPPSLRMDEPAFLEAFAGCRLHLAVQWLGWSPGWSPPQEHAHDWLGEALHLADELGL